MIFTPLPLQGAFRIDLERLEDSRGFFARTYCEKEFRDHCLETSWPQLNTSFSQQKGTLRGFHFQEAPAAETKLVRCVSGAAFDVIVDLRVGSPSFGQWTSVEITGRNRCAVYVPRGFAHAFQTLEPDTELLYLVSESHSPAHEKGLSCLDPELGIPWPLPITAWSDRDRALPSLQDVLRSQ
jgi:dTDP-4-dehydrorhamnose 3,5-epimerase